MWVSNDSVIVSVPKRYPTVLKKKHFMFIKNEYLLKEKFYFFKMLSPTRVLKGP